MFLLSAKTLQTYMLHQKCSRCLTEAGLFSIYLGSLSKHKWVKFKQTHNQHITSPLCPVFLLDSRHF